MCGSIFAGLEPVFSIMLYDVGPHTQTHSTDRNLSPGQWPAPTDVGALGS